MKSLFLVLFAIGCFGYTGNTQVSLSQRSPIKQLSAEGILLDSGWKFSPGDNPQWATPNFNDSNWQSINPILQLHKLPVVTKAGIG